MSGNREDQFAQAVQEAKQALQGAHEELIQQKESESDESADSLISEEATADVPVTEGLDQAEQEEMKELIEETKENTEEFEEKIGYFKKFIVFLGPSQRAIVKLALSFFLIPLKILAVLPFKSIYIAVERFVKKGK